MRVLITGSEGYIGSRMAPFFVSSGFEVVGLDCGFFRDCVFQPPAEVATIRKDIRDVTPEDLAGFDAIVHLAALSNDPLGNLKESWTREINHGGTVHLARTAKDAGVGRFVFSSSCSMYGAASGEVELDENAAFHPITPYAESKVRAEHDLRTLADDDFSPVFMRNATCYGVSGRLRADIVLNNLVAWGYTTGLIKVLSDGTPWRPLVHIEDLSCAFRIVLNADRAQIHNEAFNIGVVGHNYQVRDIAEAVYETVPNCEIEYAGTAGPDPRDYRVDFRKFEETFPDYHPRWNIERGARELLDAYEEYELTLPDLQGSQFIRLNHLTQLISQARVDESLRFTEHAVIER